MPMFSTKGRYALRVMIDLAEHNNNKFIPLKEIAARQEISLKYLEAIMAALSKAGLLTALHGKGGGYKLSEPPENYSVGRILKSIEGTLAPVACLECETNECSRASICKTLPMWQKFYKLTEDFFEGMKLSDLIKNETADNYII